MALGSAFYFLITTLFSVVTYALIFQFLFALFGRNHRNHVYGSLSKLSQPLVKPLRTFIPTVNKIDFALLTVIYLLHILQVILIVSIFGIRTFSLAAIFIPAAFTIMLQVLNIVSFSIIILVVMSWLAPGSYNPISDAMFYMSDWLLRPIRRSMPDLGGLDLSPMIAIIGIQFVSIAFIRPFAL